MNYKSVTILIPTYNGKRLLEEYLPSVVRAAKSYKGKTEIIVVDDGSTDGSDGFLRNNFPEVRLVKLEKNIGPLLAINEGFRLSKNDIIILLDNDILVSEDFIAPLVVHFDDKEVFGVGPNLNLLSSESGQNGSYVFRGGLVFRKGFIETPMVKLCGGLKQNLAFLLGGGAAAFDRDKLLKLGGFDELLSPFYWEDADLSYRAWKRGWKILYEPKSLIHHQGHSTISKEHKRHYVDQISERNMYILIWKNIADKRLLLCHFLWIPIRFIGYILVGKYWRISPIFLALRQFKAINSKRRIELREANISDSELLSIFS